MSAKFYLYAIAAGDPGTLPDGIGHRPVCPWVRDGVYILVSRLCGDPLQTADQEDLLAHERVVEAAMQAVTVLPFRFGTITDEPALAAFAERYRDRIARRLGQVAGHVEVTLKVLDPGPAGTPAAAPAAAPAMEPQPGLLPGSAYLLLRQAQARREEARRERAGSLVARLEQSLGTWATARHHKLAPSQHVLAAVTHLIPQPALGPWVEAAARLREQHPDLDFLASGPWPPYHFSEVTGDDGGEPEPDAGSAGRR
ncbi:MAG TPA: GvpL/GvpF family gas vesicle protein [Symbiobacteriaceae bacterium]